MRVLTYTLVPVLDGSKWVVELGVRTVDARSSHDQSLARQSFPSRADAIRWLQQQANALDVTIPDGVPDTNVAVVIGKLYEGR
jgi:hypothetical protein